MQDYILIKKLFKYFENNKTFKVAVTNFNLSIQKNEFVSIVGTSGCGKSTLINILAGFLDYDSGFISINGKTNLKPDGERTVVFQEDAVFPWMTVYENICYGPRINKKTKEKQTELVNKYSKLVGLNEFLNYYPKQLSGGMKKRVDLARAYANNPSILLMDEPFGALDVFTRQTMQKELLSLLEYENKTVIFITHDISEAILLSDRIVLMQNKTADEQQIFSIHENYKSTKEILSNNKIQELKNIIEAKIKNG